MKKTLFKFTIIIFALIQFETFANEKNYYKELITDWSRIFPDQNRNAAGPKFFKYIIDKEITFKDFTEFNKLYCAVSGSLIDPDSEPDFLFAKESKTNKKICGDYYKCCIPCSCDVMKYSEVEKMKYKFLDGFKEFYVFTIKNPCNKKNFPDKVNKNYFCDGEKINNDQVYNLNGRIVIGLLHKGRDCNKEEIDFVKSHQVTGKFCELRNNTPLESLKGGMGDIFIKLAR
ncbi:hypothetical protein [Candidatus Pelagibacter sp. HTCC7211]|uniref:hypothetical protein n=1 Tax=Pelagibacter sp. (strain HTCC7211) TaxID=439493 RepID=UPI0002DF0E58|nr:hypothetical protein [Candidatus Pelagibacter sp. HTCC7211]|tara:strand:- start:37 stop:726 length:690 start_codon:yes stop_codon:yes gene_type:complete